MLAAVASPAQTLYVANAGADAGDAIYGYSLSHLTLIYQTTAKLNYPQGIATDAGGALYVANTLGYDALKFEPPKTAPVLVVKDRGFRPDDVAVDSGGNIWVANFCTSDSTCKPGNVREFAADGTLLQTVACANLERYYFLAVNAQDDVAVAGESASKSGAVGEIPHGTAACTPLANVSVTLPGGVRFTADGNLAVTDRTGGLAYTYAKPAFATILHTTNLLGIPSPAACVFEPGDAFVWYAVPGYSGVYRFAYPGGGYPSNSLSGFSFPTGIAIGRTLR